MCLHQDGRDANQNRKELLNWNRLNRFCEPEPHELELRPKLWAGKTGIKFARTELSIPPIEISRRDLDDGLASGQFRFLYLLVDLAKRLNRFACEPL